MHVASPDQSAFRIMSMDAFISSSSTDIQRLFSKQHIVVYGLPVEAMQFDPQGMETLAVPSKIFTVQGILAAAIRHLILICNLDMSINIKSNQHLMRLRAGTTRDLANAHRSRNGKILNALDFPLPYAPLPPASIASTTIAWQHTLEGDEEFPASACKWGLAATSGAHHGFHIDCDGLGTYIEPLTGNKWWVIARPPNGDDFSVFACLEDLFTFIASDGAENPGYILEAVLLTPGVRL
jgi:hypothetical protein